MNRTLRTSALAAAALTVVVGLGGCTQAPAAMVVKRSSSTTRSEIRIESSKL
jgi:hypothetical protein